MLNKTHALLLRFSTLLEVKVGSLAFHLLSLLLLLQELLMALLLSLPHLLPCGFHDLPNFLLLLCLLLAHLLQQFLRVLLAQDLCLRLKLCTGGSMPRFVPACWNSTSAFLHLFAPQDFGTLLSKATLTPGDTMGVMCIRMCQHHLCSCLILLLGVSSLLLLPLPSRKEVVSTQLGVLQLALLQRTQIAQDIAPDVVTRSTFALFGGLPGSQLLALLDHIFLHFTALGAPKGPGFSLLDLQLQRMRGGLGREVLVFLPFKGLFVPAPFALGIQGNLDFLTTRLLPLKLRNVALAAVGQAAWIFDAALALSFGGYHSGGDLLILVS